MNNYPRLILFCRIINGKVIGSSGEIERGTNKPNGTPKKLLDISKLRGLGWEYQIILDDWTDSMYEWFLKLY